MTVTQLEKRIICISLAFALVLLGLAALAINLFHVGLPTCLTDIKPFQRGELITHSPTHYEVHYVARMWKFEPEDVTVPAGSTVDIYLSAADVTHGLILLGTNLNLMAVPGVVNYARVKFDKPRVYQLLCHEFCGTGHDRMAAELHVVDRATFSARPAHRLRQRRHIQVTKSSMQTSVWRAIPLMVNRELAPPSKAYTDAAKSWRMDRPLPSMMLLFATKSFTRTQRSSPANSSRKCQRRISRLKRSRKLSSTYKR